MAATQTDSTPATPWYFLGEVYEQQNHFPEAIGAYERALQLAASKPSASFRANLLQRRIEKLKSLPPSPMNPVSGVG
ncbi:MAG TPA: tetratricopeptide repeat protein [Terriglobia bacterium]|nr:tetratricopeptide repeat protein [Terriglobia bacterium]